MKTHPKVLKRRREERRALERAMLRALRGYDVLTLNPGELGRRLQCELWGLETARRGVK